MRTLLLIVALMMTMAVTAQSEVVAKSYFDNGDFEKALISYQKLFEENKGNTNYFFKIVEIHQQLEQLEEAQNLLLEKIGVNGNPHYYVELGYNYQLKNDEIKALDFSLDVERLSSSFASYLRTASRKE